MKQIRRSIYLEKLHSYIQAPAITVVTGPRRAGKSVLLRQLAEELISSEQVVFIDKESFDFESINTGKDLISHVDTHSSGKERRYVIVDEIQQIAGWERATASLNGDNYSRVIISGSNASLLSGDLATLIAGRYLTLSVFPLSLPEFGELHQLLHNGYPLDRSELFHLYLRFGGLPGLLHTDLSTDVVTQMQKDIVNTIAVRDIISRYNIRDIHLFESVMSFALENIGNLLSAKKIAAFLKKERRSLSVDSVLNYLRYMQDAFLLYEVPRFDIKGKKLMEINHKYYLGDIGIRSGFIGYREHDIAGILENLVFLELKRRNYAVTIGNIAGQEIDFIAEKDNLRSYIQVSYILDSPATIERELSPLRNVDDNYSKTLLTMDSFQPRDFQGIRHRSLLDFLMGEEL
ncbi:ATP-binding protein [Marispirochaeta aestuarii]|uniref:ATP-binding protein n=1 Tax=Marispirochaeta aestuarii TaxID=1963862 RepID=UPI002ABDBDAF|nr:ATP-binding protein [Marispirochaeta aestuarii]